MLSDIILLFVKENPATLEIGLSQDTVLNFFIIYKKIENVFLVDLDFNSFELIDLSFATASISGSCIIESVVRGKPI